MRFFRDGPDIKNDLLERRDEGKVVFICGAGVSHASGMPNFVELTQYVIDYFHPSEDSKIRKAFKPWADGEHESPRTPLDQVYELLYEGYGEDEVSRLVAKKLSKTHDVHSDKHDLLLAISSDKTGKPQIVTTNFDLLFERGHQFSKGEIFSYPELPALQTNIPITGITYLHGRLKHPDEEGHNYVLGSTDFGFAYSLADGQAARFISHLIDSSYTIVFIGYSAEDPPMRYLLQGLRKAGTRKPDRLYAFDRGSHEDAEAKWLRQGVTVISYDSHHILWKTIEAWAERANDPRKWKGKIVSMAQRGPKNLAPHERGQVTHLIGTEYGAKLFAEADSPPPAEWLHVFDVVHRIPKSRPQGYGQQKLEYALDGEHLPSTETATLYPHFLGWQPGAGGPIGSLCLERFVPDCFCDLPPNLAYLKQWIGRSMDQSAAALWAAGKRLIHPELINELEGRLHSDLSQPVRDEWVQVIAFHKQQPHEDDASDKADCLINEGRWANGTLEALYQSWEDFLCKVPNTNDDDPNSFRTHQIEMQKLTYEFIREYRHEISGWVENNFRNMFPDNDGLIWDAFDHVVGGLMSDDGSATKSAQGESYIAGEIVHWKKPVGKALNSPIGRVTKGCLDALGASSSSQGFLENFKPRMIRLLDSPGAGKRHTAAIISCSLNELYNIDPGWTEEWVVPALGFDGRTALAAWSGYLCGGNGLLEAWQDTPADGLFSKLKPCFLEFIYSLNGRTLEYDTEKMMVEVVISRYMHQDGWGGGFTKHEVREVLRSISDSGRQLAVLHLKCIGQNQPDRWANDIVPFIHEVWPREVHLKTKDLLSSWVNLLCFAGDSFPAVYENLRPFLLRPDQMPPQCGAFLRKLLRKKPPALRSLCKTLYLPMVSAGNRRRAATQEPRQRRKMDFCGSSLTLQRPDAYLDCLDRIIPDNPNEYTIPSDLESALALIKTSNEALADERSFSRLSKLAQRRRNFFAQIQSRGER